MASGAYGKVPMRAPGRWQERQAIAARVASEGWGIERRWRKPVVLSKDVLVTLIVTTAILSSMAWQVLMAGHVNVQVCLSAEQLLLQRLLDTSTEQLEQACSSSIRIGGGAKGSGGWKVCLDSALGRRWEQASRRGVQFDDYSAEGEPGSGKVWGDVRPVVHCRGVSLGTGIDPMFDLDLALEHGCSIDVFDHGVDVYINDFDSPRPGTEGRIKFHGRGVGDKEGVVGMQGVKHVKLVRSNSTEWADQTSLHPGYDIVAQGKNPFVLPLLSTFYSFLRVTSSQVQAGLWKGTQPQTGDAKHTHPLSPRPCQSQSTPCTTCCAALSPRTASMSCRPSAPAARWMCSSSIALRASGLSCVSCGTQQAPLSSKRSTSSSSSSTSRMFPSASGRAATSGSCRRYWPPMASSSLLSVMLPANPALPLRPCTSPLRNRHA
jgi:hypothetical protein